MISNFIYVVLNTVIIKTNKISMPASKTKPALIIPNVGRYQQLTAFIH